MIDVAVVGGGLAGGLIALALYRKRPELRIALIESGKTLGGNHRWSWFASDMNADERDLLEAFRQIEWNKGYEVRFPKYRRKLKTGYRSMSSADFHEGLTRLMPEEAFRLGCSAETVDAEGITLEGGERIHARAVIDCRSFVPSEHLRGGWQIFMGRRVRLGEAHGLERPTIMDASIDQVAPHGNGGAYRFIYVLPLAAHDVFIEDTYYADDPRLDRGAVSSRIDAYCRQYGWDKGEIVGSEVGFLPVLTGGDFTAYQTETRIEGVAMAGARGGFVHPLTSYTVPIAVENALVVAANADLPGAQLAAMFETRGRQHWRRTRFYRLLARMLFFAGEPERRVDIFQRFYTLREGLIERFYAARSNRFDQFRVLCGKPPVSIPRALVALKTRGKPLTTEKTA